MQIKTVFIEFYLFIFRAESISNAEFTWQRAIFDWLIAQQIKEYS